MNCSIRENLLDNSNANIFFYLELKKRHTNLIYYLEEEEEINLRNLHNEIILYINDNCIYNYMSVDLINFYENLRDIRKEHIEKLMNVKKNIDAKIYELCDHNFITDTIDIGLDKTQTICYCSICELTQK
jgi:hypothetical protein